MDEWPRGRHVDFGNRSHASNGEAEFRCVCRSLGGKPTSWIDGAGFDKKAAHT